MIQHIVNISGGKDSAECARLAMERGRPFRLVMADTGNESPITIDYAHRLADWIGVPLEVARRDFTREIEGKRRFVETKWREQGVPEAIVLRALDALVPTGSPFLDLCIWKGRFPSRKAQFCTEFLKQDAVERQVIVPALERGSVIQWIGVRRDESLNRRNAEMFQKVRRKDGLMLLYRPLIHLTAADIFDRARKAGMPINPLYSEGMSRVGCFPCINASKGELREIGLRFPEAVERIAAWENIVADASKRGAATFFAPDVTPESAALGERLKKIADPDARKAASAAAPWPRAPEVFDWAKTTRGGRQYDLLFHTDDGLSCSSQYGLCE